MNTDTKEISDWLSAHGVPKKDHHIILNECLADDDIRARYINIAHRETASLSKWFSTIGMNHIEQQIMVTKCRENPESYRRYLYMARNNGRSPAINLNNSNKAEIDFLE